MCEHGIYQDIPFFCDNHDCWELKAVDACIASLVLKLNNQGIRTTNSCCGHGQYQGNIIIESVDFERAIELGYTTKEEIMDGWSNFTILA